MSKGSVNKVLRQCRGGGIRNASSWSEHQKSTKEVISEWSMKQRISQREKREGVLGRGTGINRDIEV